MDPEAWKNFQKEFPFEFIVIRDFIFWAISIISAGILYGLMGVLGEDWTEVQVGIKASAWVFTVFYLIKLVMELLNLVIKRWGELKASLEKLRRRK